MRMQPFDLGGGREGGAERFLKIKTGLRNKNIQDDSQEEHIQDPTKAEKEKE